MNPLITATPLGGLAALNIRLSSLKARPKPLKVCFSKLQVPKQPAPSSKDSHLALLLLPLGHCYGGVPVFCRTQGHRLGDGGGGSFLKALLSPTKGVKNGRKPELFV